MKLHLKSIFGALNFIKMILIVSDKLTYFMKWKQKKMRNLYLEHEDHIKPELIGMGRFSTMIH